MITMNLGKKISKWIIRKGLYFTFWYCQFIIARGPADKKYTRRNMYAKSILTMGFAKFLGLENFKFIREPN